MIPVVSSLESLVWYDSHAFKRRKTRIYTVLCLTGEKRGASSSVIFHVLPMGWRPNHVWSQNPAPKQLSPFISVLTCRTLDCVCVFNTRFQGVRNTRVPFNSYQTLRSAGQKEHSGRNLERSGVSCWATAWDSGSAGLPGQPLTHSPSAGGSMTLMYLGFVTHKTQIATLPKQTLNGMHFVIFGEKAAC